MSIPWIGFDEIDHLLTWESMADALHRGHQHPFATAEDLYLERDGKGYFNRCAMIPGLGMVTKTVSIYPGNPQRKTPLPRIQGSVVLFDYDDGTPQAILDGQLITKWKTTADSILGARLLASEHPERLLIVGAGTVANYQIDAFCAAYPSLQFIDIWNRTPAGAEQLAERHRQRPQTITTHVELPHAASQADIISCATMSIEPILKGEWIQPGCHIDLIGAYLPHMREGDDMLIKNAALYVDSKNSTLEDIGELAIPISTSVISANDVLADFYELCNEKLPAYNPKRYTVFKNGGGGHLDLMCARHIYVTWKHHV